MIIILKKKIVPSFLLLYLLVLVVLTEKFKHESCIKFIFSLTVNISFFLTISKKANHKSQNS